MSEAPEKSINTALFGYGYAGKTFHAPLIANTPGLNLKTVVSSDRAKVLADFSEVHVESNAQAVFSDPQIDLVVIATPNTTHFDLAERALNSGKSVVVDKPFVTSLHDAESLAKTARETGRLLSIFHNRRWDADFLTLQKVLETGRLGDVTYFQSNFDRYRPEVKRRWREQALPGSGLWFDLGSHLVDQAIVLFGAPDSVYADLAIQRSGGESVDYFHVLLDYGKRRVVLHGSSLVLGDSPRFVLHGSAGSYIKHGLDTQEDTLKAGTQRDRTWGIDGQEGTLFTFPGDRATTELVHNEMGNYWAYYEAIRNAILFGGPNPVSCDQAIATMRILELGVASAAKGNKLAFEVETGDKLPRDSTTVPA